MSTIANVKTTISNGVDARVMARIIDEGYGPGAWHGADLKAALADVGPELAFWRPSPGRHNIAVRAGPPLGDATGAVCVGRRRLVRAVR
jgi:hypothetical protein